MAPNKIMSDGSTKRKSAKGKQNSVTVYEKKLPL